MVLEGVLKNKIIEALPRMGIKIEEQVFLKSELFSAKEIWLTNSIRGIRFVAQLEEKVFQRKNSHFDRIVSFFGSYGELL